MLQKVAPEHCELEGAFDLERPTEACRAFLSFLSQGLDQTKQVGVNQPVLAPSGGLESKGKQLPLTPFTK